MRSWRRSLLTAVPLAGMACLARPACLRGGLSRVARASSEGRARQRFVAGRKFSITQTCEGSGLDGTVENVMRDPSGWTLSCL